MKPVEIVEKIGKEKKGFYFSLALKYMRNATDAEDSLQSGFKKFIQLDMNFPTLRDGEKYLCRLLVNHFIDRLRAKATYDKIIRVTDTTAGFADLSNPEESLAKQQGELFKKRVVKEIVKQLEELPPFQREVINLLFLTEPPMTLREISKRKKVPLSTIHSRARNAINRLQQTLKPIINQWVDFF